MRYQAALRPGTAYHSTNYFSIMQVKIKIQFQQTVLLAISLWAFIWYIDLRSIKQYALLPPLYQHAEMERYQNTQGNEMFTPVEQASDITDDEVSNITNLLDNFYTADNNEDIDAILRYIDTHH